MPIHDQSYRRYHGGREQHGRAWAVIARAGIRSMIRRRVFLGLLLLSWGPFIVRAVQVYLAANFPQASILAPTAETFRQFLEQQGVFVFFTTIYAGAGLIANDRRANALQIYLSKPLTRVEYIAGKLSVLVVFLLLVTWVPAVLLLVVQVIFAGSLTFIRSNLILFPAITVLSFLQVAVASFLMLGLSSLSKSSRYVGILYAGVVFFTEAIFDVLRLITGSSALSWISVLANLEQMGYWVFRVRPPYDTHWAVTLAVLIGLVLLSALVLDRRVRGVEIVT